MELTIIVLMCFFWGFTYRLAMKNNYKLLGLLIASMVSIATARSQTTWEILSEVQFESPQFISRGYNGPKPVFSDEILRLENSEITLSGFIYPLKTKEASRHFVLSSFPISSCFFCGAAGPETVAEIRAQQPIPYTTRKIKVKGILRIHHSDPNGLLYSLENALWVKQ